MGDFCATLQNENTYRKHDYENARKLSRSNAKGDENDLDSRYR